MPGQYVQLRFEDIKSLEYFFYKQCDPSAKTHQMNICKHLKHPRLGFTLFLKLKWIIVQVHLPHRWKQTEGCFLIKYLISILKSISI